MIPDTVWRNIFWFVRQCGAAFRLGWDAAGGPAPKIGGGYKL